MVRTASTMQTLGKACPDFSLPNVVGGTVSRDDFTGRPLLVMFICNHCPYVKHVRSALATVCQELSDAGLAIVGISSNDAIAYPDDGPAAMAAEAKDAGYTFPYLYDESQATAKAFHAACTPDFFLYNADHKLVYRGQFDDSRPSNGQAATGADLIAACQAVLAKQPIPEPQKPSIGCNIKWRDAPEYFTGLRVEG